MKSLWQRLWNEPLPQRLATQLDNTRVDMTAFICLLEKYMLQLAFGEEASRYRMVTTLNEIITLLPKMTEYECQCVAKYIERLHLSMLAYGIVVTPTQGAEQPRVN